MNYIHIPTLAYPVSQGQIRAANQGVIFPDPFEPTEDYAPVQWGTQPEHNPNSHRVVEVAPVEEAPQVEGPDGLVISATYRQAFELVALTPDEIAQRLADAKAQLLIQATAKRWDVETGGITLPGGLRIDTARTDQDSITRVLVNAQAAGIIEVRFKAASGWATLSIDDLRQIASAVARHVQACYDSEHAHHVAIDALDQLADAAAYDLSAGWPA